MKCPKCNYTSFDHNESCPKCKKSLLQVREKLNLYAYAIAMPLAAQLGSPVTAASKHAETEPNFDLDFSDDLDSEIRFDPESDTKTATTDAGFAFDDETEDLSLDFSDLALDRKSDTSKERQTAARQDTFLEEELDFTLDDSTDDLTLDFDEPGIEKTVTATDLSGDDLKTAAFDSEDLTLDLEDPGTETFSTMNDKQKEKVTLELEESVSALISSIELANPPGDTKKEKKQESDLEVMDLDLDLDLDSMDDK